MKIDILTALCYNISITRKENNMKKLIIAAAVLAMALICSVSACAEDKIVSSFFPSGSISTPTEAPYIYHSDRFFDYYRHESVIFAYYKIPEDVIAMCREYSLRGIFGFNEQYDIASGWGYNIQADIKIDGGNWFSENENFDIVSHIYGNTEDYAFIPVSYIWLDDSSAMQEILLSDLFQYTNYEFLKPVIQEIEDYEGNQKWVFDLENHTLSFRYRIVYAYDAFDDAAGSDEKLLFSAWSPEASIGKNGTQKALAEPPKPEKPVISDVRIDSSENYSDPSALYYLDIPFSTFEYIRYHFVFPDLNSIFSIETEISINGGEWRSCETEYSDSVTSGIRKIYHPDENGTFSRNDKIAVRVRLVDKDTGSAATDWSDVAANDSSVSPEPPAASVNNDSGDAPIMIIPDDSAFGKNEESSADITASAEEKHGIESTCTLCGSCQQPLGMCIYTWIVIIVSVIVIFVIIILLAKSTKKENKKL